MIFKENERKLDIAMVKLPFSFFEDHSQLSYFRYTKEVAGFLESYMSDYHRRLLSCNDNSDNTNILDSHLTPKQQV